MSALSPLNRAPASLRLVISLSAALLCAPAAAESAILLPAPALEIAGPDTTETAVLAGGCFWGIQAVFQYVEGVKLALSGYAGGSEANPTYEEVSSGATGHAESVRVEFDPREISYGQILQVFFSVGHDPTQLNRQGPDTGTQYRSAIFYTSDAQRQVAEAYIAQLAEARVFPKEIVTELAPMTAFYPAEDYHQDYALRHPDSAYIVVNDLPKVANLAGLFPELFRPDPVTVAENLP